MNWTDAVQAMREGSAVIRKSETSKRLIAPAGDDGEPPIYATGTEACRLMHAWTADEKPALVFMGCESSVLFVPDSDARSATDWEILPARTP